jgi:hypothetical protein
MTKERGRERGEQEMHLSERELDSPTHRQARSDLAFLFMLGIFRGV